MKPEERKQYDKAMKQHQEAQNDQYNQDQILLNKIKGCVSPECFEDIKFELKESENTSNYKIVDEPIGSCQNEGNYDIWIDQRCGCSNDDYYGTVCMKLIDDKYLMWNYWM